MTYTRPLVSTGHWSMEEFLEPRRYVGLRVSDVAKRGDDWVLQQFQKMQFENPYFYAFHDPDNGCKHRHAHFVLLRDFDPTVEDSVNSKKLRRAYVVRSDLSGNQDYAFSFHTNSLVQAGNYMKHDPDAVIVFSEHEWKGFDAYGFEYKVQKKKVKEDVDLEVRRRDMDHIPLSRYNLVSTMQRMDRIRKRPRRSFKEALYELLTTTRYRLNKDLLSGPCPRELVEEYEKPIQEAAKAWVTRWVPY